MWHPVKERIDIQTQTADSVQVIDNRWVAVGLAKEYMIQQDTTWLPGGEASYRFELRQGDNTLGGFYPGEKVARAELSYCYASPQDYKDTLSFQDARRRKTVHYAGKGICGQGERRSYTFRIFIPREMDSEADVIFAQWHGMPTRTLLADAGGRYYRPGDAGYEEEEKRIVFRKGIGYEDGKPDGWTADHGGRPVMAFGFAKGYFYIKANSDRKWLTDTKEYCDVDVAAGIVMKPVRTRFKSSTLACKVPWDTFPKDVWVTFKTDVDWALYGREQNTLKRPGRLAVVMEWEENGRKVVRQLVERCLMEVGRNDEDGYYFKCGAYRQSGNDTPVCYYISGYQENKK